MKKHKHRFTGFDVLAPVREQLRAKRERAERAAQEGRARARAEGEARGREFRAAEARAEFEAKADSLRLGEEFRGHGQCPWCGGKSRTEYNLKLHSVRSSYTVGTRTYRFACRCIAPKARAENETVEDRISWADLADAIEADKAALKAWAAAPHRGRR